MHAAGNGKPEVRRGLAAGEERMAGLAFATPMQGTAAPVRRLSPRAATTRLSSSAAERAIGAADHREQAR